LEERRYKFLGSGPCLVLLAGFASTIESWGFQLRGLNKDYRLLAIENRRMCREMDDDQEFNVHDMIRDMNLLLEKYRIDHISILGASMGGIIGWEYANRYPERVDSFIFSSLPLKGDVRMAICLADLEKALMSNDMAFLGERITDCFFSRGFLHKRNSQFIKALFMESISRINAGTIQNQFVFLKKWHGVENYPTLPNIPCLFIYGSEDKVVDIDVNMAVIKSLLPGAIFQVIDGAGHAVHIEKPNIFNNIVREFLGQVTSCQNSVCSLQAFT